MGKRTRYAKVTTISARNHNILAEGMWPKIPKSTSQVRDCLRAITLEPIFFQDEAGTPREISGLLLGDVINRRYDVALPLFSIFRLWVVQKIGFET